MVRVLVDRLERCRIEAGLTRAELALRAGIAVATRRRVFRGKPVRLSIAARVAAAVGAGVPDLIDVDAAVAAALRESGATNLRRTSLAGCAARPHVRGSPRENQKERVTP